MSKLRNRIAQAIVAGIYQTSDDDTDAEAWLTVADAVIGELGLRDERGTLKVVRYVSNWEFDSDE